MVSQAVFCIFSSKVGYQLLSWFLQYPLIPIKRLLHCLSFLITGPNGLPCSIVEGIRIIWFTVSFWRYICSRHWEYHCGMCFLSKILIPSHSQRSIDTQPGWHAVCLGSPVSFSCTGNRKKQLLQTPAATACKLGPYLWLPFVLCYFVARREQALWAILVTIPSLAWLTATRR